MSEIARESTLAARPHDADIISEIVPVEAIVADLIAIIRTQTKDAGMAWSAATTIQETGIDSFDFVELVFEVEDKYKIDLNFNANTAENLKTVADVASLIHARIVDKTGAS